MSDATVVVVKPDEVIWPWRGEPQWRTEWGAASYLDPFPAYPHDENTVRRAVEEVAESWEPETPITFHILPFELVERTNAAAPGQQKWDAENNRWKLIEAHVEISAKRIPPHPAMTRYLVAHEYGHHVENWIAERDQLQPDAVLEHYAELRGLDGPLHGEGGTWAGAVGEVFACDFRLLFPQMEREFWPHGDIPRIDDATRDSAAYRWWLRRSEPPTPQEDDPRIADTQEDTSKETR